MNKITEFIVEHIGYKNKEELDEYIKEHVKHGTIDCLVDDKKEVIAVVRYNVVDDIFKVLDFAVRDDYRRRGIGKKFILNGLARFRNIKYIQFSRLNKARSKLRKIEINKILKRDYTF